MSKLYELNSYRNIFAHAIIISLSVLLRRDSAFSPARTFVEKNICDFFSIDGISETYLHQSN